MEFCCGSDPNPVQKLFQVKLLTTTPFLPNVLPPPYPSFVTLMNRFTN